MVTAIHYQRVAYVVKHILVHKASDKEQSCSQAVFCIVQTGTYKVCVSTSLQGYWEKCKDVRPAVI